MPDPAEDDISEIGQMKVAPKGHPDLVPIGKKIDPTNHAGVSFTGVGCVIGNPSALYGREEAIVAAATILAVLGVSYEDFKAYYDAVANS